MIYKNKFTLAHEFKKSVPPFLIYLATSIIWLSFLKDLSKVGFNPLWLSIRLAYLPFMLGVWYIFKHHFKKIYEFPLWASGFYITAFCTYFSFATGGLKSDYVFGLIEFYFGIALMS